MQKRCKGCLAHALTIRDQRPTERQTHVRHFRSTDGAGDVNPLLELHFYLIGHPELTLVRSELFKPRHSLHALIASIFLHRPSSFIDITLLALPTVSASACAP
jgi:hypothetical protein